MFTTFIWREDIHSFCIHILLNCARIPFSGLTQWAHWSFTQYLQCSNNLNILFHGVVSNLNIYTITCCTFILVHWTNKLTEIFFLSIHLTVGKTYPRLFAYRYSNTLTVHWFHTTCGYLRTRFNYMYNKRVDNTKTLWLDAKNGVLL